MADYDSFIFVDRSDTTLESLLLWWCSRWPFVHEDDCKGLSLHCCVNQFPVPERALQYALQGSDFAGFPDHWRLDFINHVDETTTEVEVGDEFRYADYQFELVKNAKS